MGLEKLPTGVRPLTLFCLTWLGVTTRTSSPNPARAFGRAPATSARPPTLENGTTSAEARRTFKRSAIYLLLPAKDPTSGAAAEERRGRLSPFWRSKNRVR